MASGNADADDTALFIDDDHELSPRNDIPMMTDDDQGLRIFAWIVPRVCSTALLKCMSFVDDTEVWMEPYLACWNNHTIYNPEWRVGDPPVERMREARRKSMRDPEVIKLFDSIRTKTAQYENLFPQEKFTYPWVKKQLEKPGKKFVFVKDFAFTIDGHFEGLPENVPTRHLFLIRHPKDVYTSWKRTALTRRNPVKPISWDECHVADEICYMPAPELYQIQYKLWRHVKEHIDPDAFVVDGHDLASNPEVILPKLFERLGIPFKESYLEWSADPEAAFSSWNGSPLEIILPSYNPTSSRAVHCSKFAAPQTPRGVPNPKWKITEELRAYIDGAMPLYEEMYASRIK